MKKNVICLAGNLTITVPFEELKSAKQFTLGFRRGVLNWDIYHEFNLENVYHRGFRLGQIMAYYCFRFNLNMDSVKAFTESEDSPKK